MASELLKSGQKHNINSCQARFTKPRFKNKSCNSPILQKPRHAGVQNPATRLGQLTKGASVKSNSALLVFAAAWFDIVAVSVQVARDY